MIDFSLFGKEKKTKTSWCLLSLAVAGISRPLIWLGTHSTGDSRSLDVDRVSPMSGIALSFCIFPQFDKLAEDVFPWHLFCNLSGLRESPFRVRGSIGFQIFDTFFSSHCLDDI